MSFSVASGRTSQGGKKLLGDLMILVISSVFHELWFLLALREDLAARATKMAFILWGRLLLWDIRHLFCCWGSKRAGLVHALLKIMQNADVVPVQRLETPGLCAGSELLSGLHNQGSLSLSPPPSFRFPPVLQQFWELRWCVPSPALKEVFELLGHERICANPSPLCFVPKEKLRLLRELKLRKT